MCDDALHGGRICCRVGDIVLRERDVRFLEPRQWLNDAVISYFFERFATESSTASVLLLEPSITYTAAMLGDPEVLREMLSVPPGRQNHAPLAERLPSQHLIILPINDKVRHDVPFPNRVYMPSYDWKMGDTRASLNVAACT